MVCTSWADGKTVGLAHVRDGAYELWRDWLDDQRVKLVGANMCYDMAVVMAQWRKLAERIFAAYKAHRIGCIQINQRLLDIANGCLGGRPGGKKYRYSLASIVERTRGRKLDKSQDTWRLRYSELLDVVDLDQWPDDAVTYAMDDAEETYDVANWQLNNPEQSELLRDNWQQAYHQFVLYLMTCRGIRTDEAACKLLIAETQREIDRCFEICKDAGLIKQSRAGKWTKQLKLARSKLRDQLPPEASELLDETIADIKRYKAKQEAAARDKVQFDYGLSEKEFRRAERTLAKLLTKDISLEERMRRWPYEPECYVDMMSLARKPRPFNALGVRLTKTGMISVDAEACRMSGDPTLKALATYTSANTLLQKAQRMLKGAFMPLQTSYTVPIATGRISSHSSEYPLVGDNFTNFRRSAMVIKGESKDEEHELPGQRECIVPRKGYVFCSIDGNSAEMRAYAQLEYWMFGDSPMRDSLNAGRNLHRELGADILGISYDEMVKRYKARDKQAVDAAQFAKIPNFALQGGGGSGILPDYAKGMGIELSKAHAKELAELYYKRNKYIKQMHKHYKSFVHKRFEHPISKRLRYIDRYAQACNNPFQGLIADAMLYAGCRLAEAEYIPGGALWGSYSVLFMHDEYLFEMPEECASEHAWRATKIFCDACTEFMPDVPMTAEPALMRRFAKGAETVLHPTKKDSDGNPLLLVWGDA